MAVVREDVVKIGFDIDGMADLNKLHDTLDETMKIASSGVGDDAFDEMIKESKKAAKGVEDIRDCVNGIKPDGIDDTVKGLKDTDKKGESAFKQLQKIAKTKFDKTVSGLKSIVTKLKDVGIQAGKFLAKGIAVGVAGVGALVAKSITNYADYEQLVGGVDTLFKDSSGTVQKYADGAYKTAGLSANDYMSTVTSFSASLIQSLGGNTGKAAELADMAITDMSDNANKMGSDMGSIQDAYQGFAKQNYTMLDNLKLGYGGTKEEMSRLLKDAEKLSGQKFDLSSYADVVEAIHVIQENMGIAGTTAEEADKTISGSWASMKAAWSNTLTSLVLGGDDLDRSIDNLVESAKTFAKNLMPALVSSLGGVGSLIEELCPLIEENMPVIVETLLPPLISAATALVKGLIVALPDIISTIVGELPGILQQVWEGISEAFGDVPGIDKVGTFFSSLKTLIEENTGLIKKLIPAAFGLVMAFKLFNKVKGLTGLFGGGGTGGGFFSTLASMKPQTALKGMANLAIIVGGLALLSAALMWAAPYMAQLSDMKSIGEVLLVIGLVGLLGTGMTKLAASVGNIPVATVSKGLANIAIVMVGFGALAAVLMWVAPYMAQLSDMGTTMKILLIIGVTGLVGAALAGLAGLVGAIPIVSVLSGLANIALALGGFAGIATAFGALTKVDGFTELLNSGGQVLADICGIIGEMAGSIVGGFAEGVTDSLPAIGENLSAFATSAETAFDKFSKIDGDGLSGFASALATLMGVLIGDAVLSFITGGNNYADFGTQLSDFATNASTFFTTVKDIPAESFGKITSLFNALSGVNSLPKEGGLVGWFEGEIDFDKMSTGITKLIGVSSSLTALQDVPAAAFTNLTALLNALAGVSNLPQDGGVIGWFEGEVDLSKLATGIKQLTGVASSLLSLQDIPAAAFTNLTTLLNALAGVNSLPKDGGIVGWFEGEVNFESLASGIQQLASSGMITALTTLSALPENAFTTLSTLFNTLAGIKAMPKEGGVAGWFTGDNSTALTNVANQLPTVATSIASFFANLGGITDFTPITALFDALAGIKSMPQEGGIAGWFTGDSSTGLTNISSKLPEVASHIADFFSNLGGRTDFTPIKSLFDTLSSIKIDSDAAEGTGLFGLGASALETMGTGLSNFATNAKTFFDTVNGLNVENMSSFFEELGKAGDLPEKLSSLDTSVGTSLSNLVTTADTKLTELKSAFSDRLGEIVTLMNTTATVMYSSGVSIMQGVNNGMNSMRGRLIATARSMAAAIQKAFDVKLDINSPSRETFNSGVFVGEGYDLGMQSKIPDLQATASKMGSAAIPYASHYSPDSDSSTIYNNRTSSEYTTIAPAFNLTISGTQDDRTTARKVKRWVNQSMTEFFESMERKSYVTREA